MDLTQALCIYTIVWFDPLVGLLTVEQELSPTLLLTFGTLLLTLVALPSINTREGGVLSLTTT